jgi:mRNA-degrading endonuclease RelE of RelBE toxin-antitoxin system
VSLLSLELAPRALRDLKHLPREVAAEVVDDLELLRALPWPGPPKVKHLQGTHYSRLRTGHIRSIVLREERHVLVLRVIARKDFERILKSL